MTKFLKLRTWSLVPVRAFKCANALHIAFLQWSSAGYDFPHLLLFCSVLLINHVMYFINFYRFLLASLFWSSNFPPLVCPFPVSDIIVFPVSPGVACGIFTMCRSGPCIVPLLYPFIRILRLPPFFPFSHFAYVDVFLCFAVPRLLQFFPSVARGLHFLPSISIGPIGWHHAIEHSSPKA
jgi:hypothetical protein